MSFAFTLLTWATTSHNSICFIKILSCRVAVLFHSTVNSTQHYVQLGNKVNPVTGSLKVPELKRLQLPFSFASFDVRRRFELGLNDIFKV